MLVMRKYRQQPIHSPSLLNAHSRQNKRFFRFEVKSAAPNPDFLLLHHRGFLSPTCH